jgi:DNA-binding MarR family transcriptional regulator
MVENYAGVAPAADHKQHQQLLEDAARQMLVMRRVMRQVLKEARSKGTLSEDSPLGEAQLYALYALSETEQMTAGDLAARCHVADPTMSKTLNHLEAHGLVARRTDPRNRRVVQVTLTEAGHTELARAGAEWVGKLAAVLSPLTGAQLQDLIVAFGHLESLVGPDEHPLAVPASPDTVIHGGK